ncbi:hypothetical protein KCP73_17805 [Salmonella enterica subsp. enterica]|nr:hypothetical protein KCP73_17805 [Salmonella enterica subsp. enterica]
MAFSSQSLTENAAFCPTGLAAAITGTQISNLCGGYPCWRGKSTCGGYRAWRRVLSPLAREHSGRDNPLAVRRFYRWRTISVKFASAVYRWRETSLRR